MSARREYEMNFNISGSLSGAFSRSFQQAAREMSAVSNVQNTLNSRIRDVSAYQRQQRELTRAISAYNNTETRLLELQRRNRELQEAMEGITNPSEQLRRQLQENSDALERTTESLNNQLEAIHALNTAHANARLELATHGIDADLSGESDRLRGAMENLTTAQGRFSAISEELRTAQSDFKQAAQEFATTAGVIAAAAGTAYAGTAKQAIDFESAFAGVKKTVEGTPEQLEEIREGILKMSQTDVSSSANDIAAVAENAGQLGIETESILKFSKTMIDLGNSTNLASDEAASSLAKFANVTKMNQSEFDRLGSVIVDLGNNFATTEADIVAMGTRLASTGELTGLSEAEIMGTAAALSSLGIEAEAGGSAMSKFLKSFAVADATGNMKKYADVAGMTVDEFSKLYKSNSLGAISAFTSGLNDVERNGKGAIEILSDMDITEIRLSNAVLALASSDGILTKSVERANAAWEENTALSREAGQRYATTESKLSMAKNSVQNLGIAVGDLALPLVRDLADEFSELVLHAQRWVSENKEGIKSFAAGSAEVAKYALMIKGAAVAYNGMKVAGLAVVKGVTKVKTAIAAARAATAAGNSGIGAFASSLTGLTASAAGFVAVGAATVAALAAIAAAVYLNDKAMRQARKDYADSLMFNNGLPKLEDYTEALKESTSQTYKFAQEINASKDELDDIAFDMKKARDSVELYGTSLRENGILTQEEAQAMINPINQLSDTLEKDFKTRFTVVFDAFKQAASDAADSLGVDVVKMAGILDDFKQNHLENLDEAQKKINTYLGKSAAGGKLTDDELSELQTTLAYVTEQSDTKSEALYDYQTAQQEIAGMDMGANQELAISRIQELQEYGNAYLEEIKEASDTLNLDYERMRAANETDYKYGYIDQQEYETQAENLNLMQASTFDFYKTKYDEFASELSKTAAALKDQAYSSAYKTADEKGASPWDTWIGFLASAEAHHVTSQSDIIATVVKGETDSFQGAFSDIEEYARGNAINSTLKDYEGLIAEIDNLASTAEITPITVPVAIQPTYEQLKKDAMNAANADAPSVRSAADISGHARGTSYSEDTFLAGELGPEIVTNAPAHTVYTAAETQQIYDGYRMFAAILPQALYAMSAMSAAASVSAPTVANYDAGSSSTVTIHYSPTINASGGVDLSAQMEQHDNEFFERLEQYFNGKEQDKRRNAYF